MIIFEKVCGINYCKHEHICVFMHIYLGVQKLINSATNKIFTFNHVTHDSSRDRFVRLLRLEALYMQNFL